MSVPAENKSSPGGIRQVARLAYPVVLTQLSGTTMHVVDTAMVGRLGATELGAVGYGGIWMWTALSLFVGTATAVQTYVSQAYGAGEQRRCGSWAWQGMYCIVPAAVIGIALFVIAFDILLPIFGVSPELRDNASTYVHMRALGAPGLCLAFVLVSFFRGLGDTKTPLYVALCANACNVLLDYGLIFGKLGLPAWGVMGAGTATAGAETIYGVMMFMMLRRRDVAERYATARVPANRQDIRRFARTGVPIGGQWILDMLSFALFSTVVARMGDRSMAASQAMITLLSISFMQAIGIQVATSTLVGQYIGARDLASAERSYFSGMKLGVLLGLAIGAVFLAFPEALLRIFTADAEVIRLGRPLVLLAAAFQLVDALSIVGAGALRGAGDTRWPFLVQTLLAWLFALPLAYVFGVTLDGGLFGAWLGMTLYVLVLAAALIWRFRSGVWKTHEI